MRILSLILALFVLPSLAAGIPVSVSVSTVDPGTASATVHLVPEAPDVSSTLDAVHARISVPGEASFDLPAGSVWKVRAEAPGLWNEELRLAVTPEPAPSLALRLYPTGRLAARIQGQPGETLPATLALRFIPSPPDGTRKGLPTGTVSCPVLDGVLSCESPAGRFDLRLRSEGFVPLYQWGVDVERGRARDLGALSLRRGAAVAGWIETQTGEVPGRPVHVELAPERLGAPRAAGEWERLRSMQFEARSNERGFFQIAGVPPGTYVLTIRESGYAPIRVSPVVVREGLQTEILDRLVLAPPARLELSIAPPMDPYGRPWNVQLIEQRAYGDPAISSWKGTASLEGTWVQAGLAPGIYQLTVADADGGRWESREIEIAGNPAAVQVEVPVVEVRGTVELGDEPLVATLWLGGLYGPRRVRFESDEEGRFQGLLPGEGLWKVDVASQAEGLRLSLDPVDVRVPPSKGYAEILVKVPATRLGGETVDEAGRKVAGAVVSTLGTAAEVESDQEGEFEIRGLKPGTVLLEAENDEKSSGTVQAFVKEEGESPRLRLVLRKNKEIQGHVVSATGPVPGAELLAIPAVDQIAGASIVTAVSGADGGFTLGVPSDVRQLTVMVFAPGYAMRILPVVLDREARIEVPVDRVGGTLSLDLAETESQPLLLHNGTFIPLPLLARWVRLRGGARQVPASGRFTVPDVEIGEYRLCPGSASGDVRQGREPQACASGFLAPAAELSLGLPSAPSRK